MGPELNTRRRLQLGQSAAPRGLARRVPVAVARGDFTLFPPPAGLQGRDPPDSPPRGPRLAPVSGWSWNHDPDVVLGPVPKLFAQDRVGSGAQPGAELPGAKVPPLLARPWLPGLWHGAGGCRAWARSLWGWQGAGGCPAPRAGEWHTATRLGQVWSRRAAIEAGDKAARGSRAFPHARPQAGGDRGTGGCRLGLGGWTVGGTEGAGLGDRGRGALQPWGTTATGHSTSQIHRTFGLDPSRNVPAAARRCCGQHYLQLPQPKGEGGQRRAGMRPGLAPAGPCECSWMSALSGCQPHPLPGLSLTSPPPASPPSPAPPSAASSCLGCCHHQDLLGLR